MTLDLAPYFAIVRSRLGKLSQRQVAALEPLTLALCEAWSDRRWVACGLGNVKLETAHTFEPIRERASFDYCESRYGHTTAIGKRLGNKLPGDGYKFRGAGLIQLTGRGHAERFSPLVGVDLVADFDAACRPEVATKIMVVGMERGLFTGKRLGDYFNADREAWRESRRIINGLDKADTIRDYSLAFKAALDAGLRSHGAGPAPLES